LTSGTQSTHPADSRKLARLITGFNRFYLDVAGLAIATSRRAMIANVPAMAAAIAFHALLSLAPLLVLVLSGASAILGSERARERLIQAIVDLGEPSLVPQLRSTVEMIVESRGNAIATVLSVLTMMYFASAVFNELGQALDRIWDVRPRSGLGGLLVQRLTALVLVPGAVAAGMLLMAFSFGHALVAPIIEQMLPPNAVAWTVSRAIVPFLLMWLLLCLVYRFGPRAAVQWSDVRVGAAITALAFTVGNTILAITLRKSMLASLYGAAGAIVLLLLWISYSANLLLLGACFTREFADRFRLKPAPGTTKPAEP
jgi:membrane protein